MPVGTKRLGLAVAALILAATCAFLIVALLMPANSVRDAVKAEIRAVTGLEPVVGGGVSVSLFPSGRVSLEDVTLGDNRTGATALTAEYVLARLRFLPLLIGQIEIADILLVRPTITVVLDHDRGPRTGQVTSKPWPATCSLRRPRPHRFLRFASRTAPSFCRMRQTKAERS